VDAASGDPAFPTNTSGHSTFSSAGAAVLAGVFGTDAVSFTTGSDFLPGVTRSFTSFSAAAAEAGQSRIHYQFDNQQALAAGRALGEYVVGHFLTPRHGSVHPTHRPRQPPRQGRRRRPHRPRDPVRPSRGRASSPQRLRRGCRRSPAAGSHPRRRRANGPAGAARHTNPKPAPGRVFGGWSGRSDAPAE